jgi:TolB-like protein/Flp pilus assembly protein TadD
MQLLHEARRRGLLKVATAYLVVSWITLEIGHTLFYVFDLPHGALQFIFVLLMLGFPIVLLGTWHGWFVALVGGTESQGSAHGDGERKSGHHEGPVLAVVFAVVALIAVGVAIGVRFFGMSRTGHGTHATDSRADAHGAPEAAAVVQTPQSSTETATDATASGFNPPPHSIAVMPFVNLSGDAAQEYFSDGLSEELLNSLVRVNALQVAARMSSFSFKGQKTDIRDIARKLNVASILEGSVRKDGSRVRISAQLTNTVTGFHQWSQSYDRDLKDILGLQSEIAAAVTSALQTTLLGTEASSIETGGTRDPQAFDAFLRAEAEMPNLSPEAALQARIAGLTDAIRLDPQYAQAYARRAYWLTELGNNFGVGEATRRNFMDARADAEKAIALAPSLGRGHLSLALLLSTGLRDYAGANAAIGRAIELAPGDAEIVGMYARLSGAWGRSEGAIKAARRATALDPLTARRYRLLATTLISARRFPEAVEPLARARSLEPKAMENNAVLCSNQYAMGQLEAALESCSRDPDYWSSQTLLAIVLHKLKRRREAQAMLDKLITENGDSASYQYAEIYAQWDEVPKALGAIETAYRENDPGLLDLKTDFLLDPLRQQPRFQAVMKKLSFP